MILRHNITITMHYTSEYKKQRKGMQETYTLAYLLMVSMFDPLKRKEKHSWFIKKKNRSGN